VAIDHDRFILTNEQYDSGIALDEYNDKYSIASAYLNKNGQVALKWVFQQKWDKDTKKSVPGKNMPLKIELGTRDEAIETLKDLLRMLGYFIDVPTGQPDGELPF
jgi:hypothetical protein